MQPFLQFKQAAATYIVMRASSETPFVMRSATLIAVIAVLSTGQLVEWHRTLSAGGTKASMLLRSVAGTFGKRCNDVAYAIDYIKWLLRERRIAKMKYPWYYMG